MIIEFIKLIAGYSLVILMCFLLAWCVNKIINSFYDM